MCETEIYRNQYLIQSNTNLERVIKMCYYDNTH